MANIKDYYELQQEINAIKEAIAAGNNPTEILDKLQDKVNDVRQRDVGATDTIYEYECKNNVMCPKDRCSCSLNYMMKDLSYCGNVDEIEVAKWDQVHTTNTAIKANPGIGESQQITP